MADLENDANHKGTVLRNYQGKQMDLNCRRDYCLSIPSLGRPPHCWGSVQFCFLSVTAASDVCAWRIRLCTETTGFPLLCPGRAVAEASVFYTHTEWHTAHLEGRGANGLEGAMGSQLGTIPRTPTQTLGPPALPHHFVMTSVLRLTCCFVI